MPEDIPVNAKKCGKCGAKQGNWAVRHPVWTAIIVIFVIGIIAGAGSGSKSSLSSSQSVNVAQKQTSDEVQQQEIEYIIVTKDQLTSDLDNNAAAAKDKWNKQYVEVTGKLANIDSDLKYISLESQTEQFDFQTIHCSIKNNEQKEKVKALSKGQDLTVRGQITEVGEIMGYSMDIIEIL